MKADYFAQYYNDENREGKYTFNDGKIKLLGNVKSVGASVKDRDGKIQKANINIDEDSAIIESQQNEFARNVFAMGDITGLGDTLYQDQTVKRTVSNQINFDEIRNIDMENINEDNGRVILKAKVNESDKIKITNGQLEGTSDIIEKGLIITNCDIIIEGSFNFTGNIITAGNIIFQGEGEITYDPQVIRNILALNAESLKAIFEPLDNNRVEVKVNSSSESYSADEFLDKSLWKIVK